MKKYIHTAQMCKPKLTDKAAEYITEKYAELRSVDDSNSMEDKERVRGI